MANTGFVFDLTNYKDTRGAKVDPGTYRVVVDDMTEDVSSKKKTPMFKIGLRILGGDEDGMVLQDRLYLTDSSTWRLVSFLQAIGIPTPRKKFRVPINSIMGRKLDVEVQDGDPYNGRVRSEVTEYIRIPKSETVKAPEPEDDGDPMEDFISGTGEPDVAEDDTPVTAPTEEPEATTAPAPAKAEAPVEDDDDLDLDLDDLDV